MRVRVVAPPEPIVSTAEAKKHVRVDQDMTDDDSYLDGLVATAQMWLDGPGGWLERSIGPQLLELTDDAARDELRLPYGPVLEIVEVTVDGEQVEVEGLADTLRLAHGSKRVRYWAGYGRRNTDTSAGAPRWISEAPAPIKHAVLLLVGQWWIVREAVNVGNIVNEMPFGVEALLQPYRVWR